MPTRLTDMQRTQWHTGPRKQAAAVRDLVTAGVVQCDTCESPGCAIGHHGDGSPVRVECGPCFLARLKVDRSTRPTRAEMIANAPR